MKPTDIQMVKTIGAVKPRNLEFDIGTAPILLLILFIIFLPQGILGAAMEWRERRSRRLSLAAERA